MGRPEGVNFDFRGHNLENLKRDVPFKIFDCLNKYISYSNKHKLLYEYNL